MAALSSTSSLIFQSRLTVPNLSFQSNLYPLRITHFQTTPSSSFSQSSTISISCNPITARYGGGGGSFSRPISGDSRRNRQGGSNDDDPALNISSIRYLLFLMIICYFIFLFVVFICVEIISVFFMLVLLGLKMSGSLMISKTWYLQFSVFIINFVCLYNLVTE